MSLGMINTAQRFFLQFLGHCALVFSLSCSDECQVEKLSVISFCSPLIFKWIYPGLVVHCLKKLSCGEGRMKSVCVVIHSSNLV